MYRISNLKLTLLLISGLTISHLWGENNPLINVNKKEAILLALQNNKSLQAAKVSIEEAKARYQYAGKLENPEVKFGYSGDWAFNDVGESTFDVGFEQRFPVTNKLRLQKEVAEVEILLAETEVLNQERLLISDVESAITSVVYIEKQLSLRQSLIELYQKFTSFIESRVQSGEASSFELNQIKVELYSVEQEIQQLENKRMEHMATLQGLLGLNSKQQLVFNADLKLPDHFVLPEYSLDHLLAKHPQYQLKQLFYEIADTGVSLAMADKWEDIAVEVFFENERSVDEPEGIGTGRFLGVGVSIPLPLNNAYRSKVKESKAMRERMEIEMEALSMKIQNEADFLAKKALALYEQVFHYKKNITELVNQNYDDVNGAYSNGQIGLNDLFRSQEQRLKIESNYLSMVHEFAQTYAAWKTVTASNHK